MWRVRLCVESNKEILPKELKNPYQIVRRERRKMTKILSREKRLFCLPKRQVFSFGELPPTRRCRFGETVKRENVVLQLLEGIRSMEGRERSCPYRPPYTSPRGTRKRCEPKSYTHTHIHNIYSFIYFI